MNDTIERLADGTLVFLPERLNRDPAVLRGLTNDEMWVAQFFCQDDNDFTPYLTRLTDYIHDSARGTVFTEAYLELSRRHLKAIAKPGGLFEDKVVTRLPWRGNNRRVRLVVYRWLESDAEATGLPPVQSLQQACERVTASLQACEVQSMRVDGRGLYAWLVPWFNPAPKLTDEAPEEFYRQVAYPEPGDGESLELPFDHDFSERLFFNEPRSDAQHGLWFFDDQPHRVMVVDKLRRAPLIGQLTGETRKGDAVNALFDQLPEGTVMSLSKTVTDKLRAYLLSQSIEGIPSSNIAVFDELQSHGLVESTPEGKAIWTALVTQGNWKQSFTFLRLQPALIWGNEDRPETFSGTVSIAVDDHPTDAPVSPPPNAVSTRSTQSTSQPDPLAMEDADYLGTLLDMFELEKPEASDAPSENALETSTLLSDNPGYVFLNWVKEGILSHKLIINDSKAKIHTVSGTVFLVTPGLFQRYVQEFPGIAKSVDQEIEEWRWVQKQFEKLKVHRKRDNGLNIWACQVQGPRKRTTLKGYLIEDPKHFFELIPPDNPFLKIAEL